MKYYLISRDYWRTKYFSVGGACHLVNSIDVRLFNPGSNIYCFPLHSNIEIFKNIFSKSSHSVIGAREEDIALTRNKLYCYEQLQAKYGDFIPWYSTSYETAREKQQSGNALVSKIFNSTKGRGVFYGALPKKDFFVVYLDGDEFSTTVIKTPNDFVVLPTIYKGKTDKCRVHPSLRARSLASTNTHNMISNLALKMSEQLKYSLIAEFEFIVQGGHPYLIEVNPRISGTLKLSLNTMNKNLDNYL